MPDPTPKHKPTKLTKTYVDKVKPGPKDEFHWDTEVTNFGLRVSPTGKRVFVCQGRLDPRKPAIRISIGPYGAFTVEQARDVAREHLRSLRMGIDPRAAQKQADAEAVTLKQCFDSYLSRPGRLKDSTKDWYRFFIEKTFKDWQDVPVVQISREMVRERHAKLVAEGLPGKKRKGGAPASANSAMVVLRVILNYAADEHVLPDGSPLIASNPVRALKRHWVPAGDRSERYIEFSKIGEVWNALQETRTTARNADVLAGVNYVMFLMVVGRRRGEAASLRWDEVHIDRENPAASYWFLREQKVGKPVRLPLSSAAIVILDGCKRVEGNPHVFPSRGKGGHVVDPRSVFDKVDEVAGRKVGAHGLRRTLVNLAQREFDIERFRIKMLVGHQPDASDVTARYYTDLSDLTFLHPVLEQVGDWIVQKGAVAAGKNVIALPARAQPSAHSHF